MKKDNSPGTKLRTEFKPIPKKVNRTKNCSFIIEVRLIFPNDGLNILDGIKYIPIVKNIIPGKAKVK